MWTGFIVLFFGTLLGTDLHTLNWNVGARGSLPPQLCCSRSTLSSPSNLLYGLATLTVMTARMTVGTAMLFIYVIASDRLGPVTELNAAQWTFVIVTGCFLLLFTATTFTAIRHASVSTVLAIGTAAPIITTLLQVIATGASGVGPRRRWRPGGHADRRASDRRGCLGRKSEAVRD